MAKKPKADADQASDNPLHPRRTSVLFGHEREERIFVNAYSARSLHHAWLISGERGIGKATFAYRAARFLLSRDMNLSGTDNGVTSLSVSPASPTARQIASGAHPAFFVLESEGGTISADAVRGLRHFLGLTSATGWRAVVVDDVNSLTIPASNALLKALEEPPPRTVFFLVSHGGAAVMPTIRSRCVRVTLKPLNKDSLQKAVRTAFASVERELPDAKTLDAATGDGGGSVSNLLAKLDETMFALQKTVDGVFRSLPRLDVNDIHTIIRSATGARNADVFSAVCDMIETKVEREARRLAGGPGSQIAAGRWAGYWSGFRTQRQDVETLNLDKGAFLIGAFSDMQTVSREITLKNPQ